MADLRAASPGDPGRVRSSVVSSARHRIVTRLRLMRMAPRRRRALADLHSGIWPPRTAVGQVAGPAPAGRSADRPPPASGAGEPAVLVLAHVYYPDLWHEIAARIERIPGAVDLAVSLVAGRADHLAGPIANRFPGAVVRVVENRGRDLWPLLQMLDTLPGHDVVLKVHTKRSPHMRSGDAWRQELLDGVCGTGQQAAGIRDLFRADPRIGIVAPAGNVLGREFMGNNGELFAALVGRSGLVLDMSRLWFPAGSMFWARVDALLPLADLNLGRDDFADETGAIDGTLPHALERYLGAIVASQQRVVVESSEVDRLLAEAAAGQ